MSGRHIVVPGDSVLLEPGSLMVCVDVYSGFYPVSRGKDYCKIHRPGVFIPQFVEL